MTDITPWIATLAENSQGVPNALVSTGIGADLTLLVDASGVIRHMSAGQPDLRRELGSTARWLGLTWSETVTRETRPAVDALLRFGNSGPAASWRHVDLRTIAGAIIPLLFTAMRTGSGDTIACGRDLRPLDLTGIVLDHDASVARAYGRAMRARGIGLETLWLDVLAPAARRLGSLWLHDACSFVDVTAGVASLQEVLHDSANQEALRVRDVVQSKRILLAAAPGQRHCFGIAMVAEFFRQAGWFVRLESAPSEADLLGAAKRNWFAVVGISESDETRLDALAALIRELRGVSRNPAVRIMVGGQIFTHKPELARQAGADATAFDGRQAVLSAQRFLDGSHHASSDLAELHDLSKTRRS